MATVVAPFVVPMLLDINLHNRVTKLMVSHTYAEWDLAAWLGDTPLLFGIWHAYKHTLEVTWKVFFPLLDLFYSRIWSRSSCWPAWWGSIATSRHSSAVTAVLTTSSVTRNASLVRSTMVLSWVTSKSACPQSNWAHTGMAATICDRVRCGDSAGMAGRMSAATAVT